MPATFIVLIGCILLFAFLLWLGLSRVFEKIGGLFLDKIMKPFKQGKNGGDENDGDDKFGNW